MAYMNVYHSHRELNKTAYKFPSKCHHKLYRVAAAVCVTERFYFLCFYQYFQDEWSYVNSREGSVVVESSIFMSFQC